MIVDIEPMINFCKNYYFENDTVPTSLIVEVENRPLIAIRLVNFPDNVSDQRDVLYEMGRELALLPKSVCFVYPAIFELSNKKDVKGFVINWTDYLGKKCILKCFKFVNNKFEEIDTTNIPSDPVLPFFIKGIKANPEIGNPN